MFNTYLSKVASGTVNDRLIDDDKSIDCVVNSHERFISLQLIQEDVT